MAKTLKEYIEKHQITIKTEQVDENPNFHNDGRDMFNWKCTLNGVFDGRRRQFTTFFSQGSAHTKRPTAGDLLHCLFCDAFCIDDGFDEFCSNCGYDNDSRKAEAIYNLTVKLTKKFDKFLGEPAKDIELDHDEY